MVPHYRYRNRYTAVINIGIVIDIGIDIGIDIAFDIDTAPSLSDLTLVSNISFGRVGCKLDTFEVRR